MITYKRVTVAVLLAVVAGLVVFFATNWSGIVTVYNTQSMPSGATIISNQSR